MANIRKSFNFRSGLQVDNDNFVINSNGLVGIGTSSPSQYLCNIHGDLRVTGSIIGRDASFSGGLEVLGITTVGVLTASSIDAPEGRIGILTATQIQIGNGNTLTSLVGYAITDAWLVPDNIGIVTTRKVGIGTDLTPSEQLRVVGDTNVTGTFTAGSIESNTNVTNGISTFNDIRVGTAISISAGVITATTFDGNFTGTVTGTATTAQFLTDGANIIAGTISDDRLPDVITSNINILTGTSYFNQIGVGTNAPLSDIHVRKDAQTEIQVTSDSNAALIGLGRSNNITGYNGVFRYGNNDVSFPYSDVYSLDIMNYGPGNINFYLNPSSVAGATGGFFWHNEANRLMALTSAGNLGIGITDPTNKFEVVGTSYISGNAEFGDNVTVTNNVILGLNGRIGINSTSPTEKLDVVGNIVASGSITGSNIEADNINVVGFVTASQFKGDASQLTGITGAAGGTYGGATSVPQLVINNEGRITGINQITIQQSTGGQIGIFSGGVEVGTGITALNFIGTGNTFAVSGATVDISIQGGGGGSSDPVGTIVAWSGSVASIPSEYQLCDGSAASTSALQAITGANVPDLTNRFIVGAGNTTVAGTYPGVGVGSTGGSANAVLIGHSHGTYGDESGYRHPVRAGADASFDWDSHTASSNDGTYDTNSRTDATGQNAAGISSTSQTGTNANLPPYYALCYIIKHTATASSGGGISGITVEDESSPLSTTATTLNFVGAGVTASGTGATKTITINGGGSGGGGSSLWSSGIGSDIYYNSGDVGIGTTNPTAVLDVDGYTELDDVNISGVVTSTSFVKSGGTNLQYLMADGSVSTVSGISTSDGDGIIAYANFDGTLSSPITARAQRGFSSITKTSNTNGRYTLTFATAQPNADYIVQATGGTNSTAVVNVLSATTTEILLQTGTNSNGAVNLEYVYITVYDSLSGGTGIGTDGNVNTTGIITAHLGSFDNLSVSGVSTFIDGGNGEIKVYENSGDPIIEKTGNGSLHFKTNNGFDIEDDAGNYFARYGSGGGGVGDGVSLYHDGLEKIGTTNAGVVVTGILTASSGIVTYYGDGSNLTGLTGAGASTYGDANTTPVITVDSNGRITGISTVATAGSGSGSGGGGSQDPVGTIVAWSGSIASIPSDYQICDGSAASTSALQAITGANVPDLRDRFVVGVGSTGSTYSVGDTGGANTVTLTENQIPSHTHGYDRATQRNVADGGVNGAYVSSLTSATTGTTGGGQSHENRPPYYALCYIIKHTATASSSGAGITLLPAQTIDPAAQATSVEFTNIPADALEITVMFEGASLSGTDDFEIQLGTDSGYIVSNYDSMSQNEGGADKRNSTSSFILRSDNASHIRMGSMLIKKASDTSYVQTGQFAISPSSTEGGNQTYGSLSSVSGTVNKLRIKSSGSNHFDAGSISVSYKTAGSGSGGSGFVLETAKSSATGNSDPIEFTGIPADAQEITLMFNGVSLSGDNEYLVQLGTAVGYATTGYASLSQDEGGTNPSDSTEGFIILGNAGHELRGKFDITKFSDTAYTFEGQARKNTTGGAQSYGSLNGVNGAITKLRIKPTGSNNFDAGLINISYKTASSGGGGSSLWSSGDSQSIYYNSGDVGIGSTSPTAKLDVDGTLNVSGVSTFITSDTVNQPWPTSSGDGTAIRIKSTLLSSYDSTGNGSVSALDMSKHLTGEFPANVSIANTLGTAGINFSDGDLSRETVGLTQYSGSFAIFTRNTTYDAADNYIWASPTGGINVGYSTAGNDVDYGFVIKKTVLDGNGTPTEILKIQSTTDNLLFSGNNVGIGSALPTAKLDVDGTLNVSGIVTATSFSGSGSALTGLTGAGVGTYGSSTVSPIITVNSDGRITGITTAAISGGGGGGGTVSSGSFTASAGSPSTLETYAYDSAELVFEYTVFVKNGSDYQTQKLLVMRDGTTVDSTQYAIMHSNGLLVQLDATISGSNLLLRATPETGVTGNTTYRIKREVV